MNPFVVRFGGWIIAVFLGTGWLYSYIAQRQRAIAEHAVVERANIKEKLRSDAAEGRHMVIAKNASSIKLPAYTKPSTIQF